MIASSNKTVTAEAAEDFAEAAEKASPLRKLRENLGDLRGLIRLAK